jgi:hypothetical protein
VDSLVCIKLRSQEDVDVCIRSTGNWSVPAILQKHTTWSAAIHLQQLLPSTGNARISRCSRLLDMVPLGKCASTHVQLATNTNLTEIAKHGSCGHGLEETSLSTCVAEDLQATTELVLVFQERVEGPYVNAIVHPPCVEVFIVLPNGRISLCTDFLWCTELVVKAQRISSKHFTPSLFFHSSKTMKTKSDHGLKLRHQ